MLAQSVDKIFSADLGGRQDIQVINRKFKILLQNFKYILERTIETDIASKSIPPSS